MSGLKLLTCSEVDEYYFLRLFRNRIFKDLIAWLLVVWKRWEGGKKGVLY